MFIAQEFGHSLYLNLRDYRSCSFLIPGIFLLISQMLCQLQALSLTCHASKYFNVVLPKLGCIEFHYVAILYTTDEYFHYFQCSAITMMQNYS